VTEPIARIEAALRDLGADHEPPVGWEARVLAATAPRKSWRWWWFAAPASALAVVVIVILHGSGEPGLQIALTYTPSSVAVRGDASMHVGDIVHATATGGGAYHAVWIYRNDVLLLTCPGARQCRISHDAITADATLAMGRYAIIALTSDSPLPPPAGSYDTDLARAREAGADVVAKHVDVR
jgi:hypothetical protein